MKRKLFSISALIVVSVLAAQVLASRRFSARIDVQRRDLLASQDLPREEMSDPPPLVLAFAERNGGRLEGPLAVRMSQKVEMRLKPGAGFFPLTATQDSGTRVPGFVWDARGRMARIVPLRIADSYVAGAGWLEVRIAGAVPVALATGPAIDKGEAMRFLAELAWNPDAILGASGLHWRQIDATTVEVSMRTNGGMATVSLLFDAGGDIVGIAAGDRPRAVARRDREPFGRRGAGQAGRTGARWNSTAMSTAATGKMPV